MMKRICIFICLLFVFTAADAGKIYKWRDKDGKLHFSQKRPPADSKRLERTEGTGTTNTLRSRWSDGMKSNAKKFMGKAGVRRVWIDRNGNRVKSRNRY